MKKDFDLIVKRFPMEQEEVNIYPLGDLHIGSQEFSVERWETWKKMVMEDPNGAVVLVGDLVDNGLRNSKTNPYEATMRPWDQKIWLSRELKPLKSKIIGAVRGNHEVRTTDLSDGCPLYDILAKLDLEDLYRENMAFLKVGVGRKSTTGKQFTYTLGLAHGASKTKTEKFAYALDGVDIFVTGHIHQPMSMFPSKIVVDSHNEVVRMVDFQHIVCPSFLKTGGYGLKAMYLPQGFKIPVAKLSGEGKKVDLLWTS